MLGHNTCVMPIGTNIRYQDTNTVYRFIRQYQILGHRDNIYRATSDIEAYWQNKTHLLLRLFLFP